MFLAFLLVPVIEIALFIQVGGLIGLWPTLAIVILTAVLGTWLVRAIQFVMIKSQLFAPAEEKERLALPSNHAASAGFEAEGGKMARGPKGCPQK